jgi:hypothetical protein
MVKVRNRVVIFLQRGVGGRALIPGIGTVRL